MSKFSRGSLWRRWDLHLHTKGTLKNDNFTSVGFNEFCKVMFRKALDAEIAAIGITDYFSIENYKKVVSYVEMINDSTGFTAEEQKKIKLIFILPNVELRMLPVTDSGRLINIHCIFDPEYVDSLENNFFAAIKHSGGPGSQFLMNRAGMIDLGKSLDTSLDDEAAFRKGVNSFIVSHESLQKLHDENSEFRDHVLFAVSNSNKDGVSGLQKHYDLFEDCEPGSLDAVRRAVYKLSNLILSANEKDRNYFLGESKDTPDVVINKCGSIKPCIHGSDAHSEDKLFLPDNNRFCWIKADPTFQGLKQIIFEPKDRVRIQESNPSLDFKKPYFNSMSVKGQAMIGGIPSFEDKSIPLNPGMIALIGGRGTGKSILLDCLYKLFKDGADEKDRIKDICPDEMTVVFSKSDRESINYSYKNRFDAKLDYLHVRQGEIKEIAEKPEVLSEAIKKLLGIDISRRAPEYDQEISVIINRIEKSLAWFALKNEEGQLVNDRKHNENVIKSNQALINTITTDQNKENIEKYQTNRQEINGRNSAIARLTDLKTNLTSYKLEINRHIEEVNKLPFDVPDIPLVNFTKIEKLIDGNIQKLKSVMSEFNDVNKRIEEEFRNQGIDQDISGLLKKIAQYQREIDEAKEKISEFDDKLKAINTDVGQRVQLVDKIVDHLQSQIESINNAFSDISNGKEGWTVDQQRIVDSLLDHITIKGKIHFNTHEFYKGLSEILNGSKFRATGTETQESRVRGKFNVNSYEDYIRLLKNDKIISNGDDFITINEFYEQKDYFLKGSYNIYQYLYLYVYRNNYLNIQPIITYLNKPPYKLSVGQRGTFYVCMKLATDPFGSPFVFDQPEDDLDNDFIMKELVPMI